MTFSVIYYVWISKISLRFARDSNDPLGGNSRHYNTCGSPG